MNGVFELLLPKMLRPVPYPNFLLTDIPESERRDANRIAANLAGLHAKARDYASGLALFVHCDFNRQTTGAPTNQIYDKWLMVAARDCAMSIYHFGRIIEGIDKSLAQCQTIFELIDPRELKKSRKKFVKSFPYYITMRHAVAHEVERYATTGQSKKQSAGGKQTIQVNPEVSIIMLDDEDETMVTESFYGTTFTSMWEGKVVSCEISETACRELEVIADAYLSVFDSLVDRNPKPLPTITVSETDPRL